MTNFGKKLIVGLVATLIMADAVAPALAQPWGPPPPPPGWGRPPPPPMWRHRRHHRCWVEERRVRVWTDWGPRWRIRHVRVCR